MYAAAMLSKQTTYGNEARIAELQEIADANDQELSRMAQVRNVQQITTLRNITDHIHTLDIDPDLKRTMTEACLKIMENELMARRLNIELTQNDLVFVLKLEKKHPNLSPRDLRICLYTKLGYYTTEMAGFCKIGKRGMESVRYRIHRMLGIGPSESIKSYLTALSLE